MTQVLIVDDSRLAAKVVQQILEAKKIQSFHIQSVAELFGLRGTPSKLRDLTPDAILLDLVMPEMDGLDVLRRLKARNDTKDVPVVMLSSSAHEHTIQEAANLGAAGYVTKPVKPQVLYDALLKAIRSQEQGTLQRRLTGDFGSFREAEQNDASYKAGVADLNYMVDILDGDMETLHVLVNAFLEQSDEQLSAIKSAIDAGDADAVRRAAHRFKGSVGNFGAPMITDNAFDLERMGSEGNLANADKVYETLAEDAQALIEDLQKWLTDHPPE